MFQWSANIVKIILIFDLKFLLSTTRVWFLTMKIKMIVGKLAWNALDCFSLFAVDKFDKFVLQDIVARGDYSSINSSHYYTLTGHWNKIQ